MGIRPTDMAQHDSAILLIHCPDARGIVASVAGFLYAHGANILSTDEHREDSSGALLMRVEWDLDGFWPVPAGFRGGV